MKALTIVIPAYNEEKRIEKTLTKVGRYFAKKDIDVEVLIVVNNTTDNTVEIIKNLQTKYPFIKYTNIHKAIGKGGALSVGFRKSTGKYVAFIDADGASSIAQLNKLYRKISANDDIDIVIANRYDKDSRINNLPFYRKVFSRLFNLITRFGFGLPYSDTQCGLKIFKSEHAKEFSKMIISRKWTIDLNLLLLAKRLDLNVVSVPIIWSEKGNSTLDIKKAFKEVVRELLVLKINDIKYVFNIDRKLVSKENCMSYKAQVM